MNEFSQVTVQEEQTYTPQPQATTPGSPQEAYQLANQIFRQDPDWVTFFREVLGVDGVVRRLFPSAEQRAAFERTNEYNEIQQMLAKLRDRNQTKFEDKEPTRVITVRLPKSLHESLRAEAHTKQTSMNKLCISKLLQVIDDELIPSD
ncbi:MAG: hypothetical protein CL681_18520 [Blastopirellula sp.]|nr:hypothetical protein [Blastopirellula sp.]